MDIPTHITVAPALDCFTGSARAVYLASVLGRLSRPSVHLVLAADKKNAYFATSDLYNFFASDTVFYYPANDDRTGTKEASAKVQRTAALGALGALGDKLTISDFAEKFEQGTYDLAKVPRVEVPHLVIVSYAEALDEPVPQRRRTQELIMRIKRGDALSHDFIRDLLFDNNFRKVDFVSEPGEFAVRGSIIDIFSYSDNQPYRIDFFGDEIESIRRFDADTQLSIEEYESIDIYPDLTEVSEQDTVPFWDILPEGTVLWDFRDIGSERKEPRVIPQPTFNKNFNLLAEDISERLDNGWKVTILSPNDAQTSRLKQIFRDIGSGIQPDFMPVSLHEGYQDREAKCCFYTDHQIFERYHKVRIRRRVERSERLTLNELNEMKLGDYVVHIDHGVGRYGGLVKLHVDGRVQEAVKIEYRDGDTIFVSIHGIHRISRYRSRDDEPPKIYKLGSKAWENLKRTTKSRIKDIAKDLINLYSLRQKTPGFAFSPDNYLQQELESSFIYEDTPDQQKASEAVKHDMEDSHPMDRLICGDVGFGKTEIAVRAAFKAVCDSKQVAILVPTTILALQHYRTFSERLSGFPCSIDYISRLRTAKDIRDIQERLANGKLDIVIGTHRLLNKAVTFKDLGLLVIDEEQKFGVTAKERLRQMKANVDTLTLTATPIPRTLQFSLLGARDLSIINTPPPNRLPVYTEVIRFNDDDIAEIISRELERGGQVFFVHNRVEDILSVQEILQRIVPQASICMAHGQMEPAVLESKMLSFMNGEYDILLSTTIMENGIDIPNANTIIINQAHRFGLSDLHQLRGRVGRSNVKAYCYLVVPQVASLTEDARRRIRAIEAFSDLGSGFNISMQDLDIRGAGNLLGAEQSGFVAEMGFETYMKILGEAMAELPANVRPTAAAVTDVQVETDLEVLIPDDYVDIPSEKIRLYRELDGLGSEDALKMFASATEDRFGKIPPQMFELMQIVRLRLIAQHLGFERITLKKGKMVAWFVADQTDPFYQDGRADAVLMRINELGSRFKIGQKPGTDRVYCVSEGVASVTAAVRLMRLLTPDASQSA